jgi:hypothetical protein
VGLLPVCPLFDPVKVERIAAVSIAPAGDHAPDFDIRDLIAAMGHVVRIARPAFHEPIALAVERPPQTIFAPTTLSAPVDW